MKYYQALSITSILNRLYGSTLSGTLKKLMVYSNVLGRNQIKAKKGLITLGLHKRPFKECALIQITVSTVRF